MSCQVLPNKLMTALCARPCLALARFTSTRYSIYTLSSCVIECPRRADTHTFLFEYVYVITFQTAYGIWFYFYFWKKRILPNWLEETGSKWDLKERNGCIPPVFWLCDRGMHFTLPLRFAHLGHFIFSSSSHFNLHVTYKQEVAMHGCMVERWHMGNLQTRVGHACTRMDGRKMTHGDWSVNYILLKMKCPKCPFPLLFPPSKNQ